MSDQTLAGADTPEQVPCESTPVAPIASRRAFLAAAGLSGAAAAGYLTLGQLARALAQADAEGRGKPNVLFIIADDWGMHGPMFGDETVPTPTLSRLAEEGAVFTQAFVSSPSCSPARAAILTGRYPFELGLHEGGSLSGPMPDGVVVYTPLLQEQGYHVGYTGKGYGPAWLDPKKEEYPGGKYPHFRAFLQDRRQGQPFLYWFGSSNPHYPFDPQVTQRLGVKPADVAVPPFLVDHPDTRRNLADYYAEIKAFDEEVDGLLRELEQLGEADNTLVIVTSDNGMPFPRAKGNLYDGGTNVPLIVRWPGRVDPGRRSDAIVNLVDLMPTFVDVAGAEPPDGLHSRSLVPLLSEGDDNRDERHESTLLMRETHVPHPGGTEYPMRALRTQDYLYIRNLMPDNWPAGPPDRPRQGEGMFGQFPDGFVDVDSPKPRRGAKTLLVERFRAAPDHLETGRSGDRLADLALGKRPAEELYDVRQDPHQMTNLATDPRHADTLAHIRQRLREKMRETEDPRLADWPDDPA